MQKPLTPNISFYNLAWRWHFYAGLFVIPFLILLSVCLLYTSPSPRD